MDTLPLSDYGHLPLFAGLSPDEAKQFLALGQRLVMPKGQQLTVAGEPADSFYLILRGAVEVRVNQNEVLVPVALLQAGQLIGEMAFFQARPFRLADAFVIREALLYKFLFFRILELGVKDPPLSDKIRRNLRFVTTSRAKANLARSERGTGALLTDIQRRMCVARCQAFMGFGSEELTEVVKIAYPFRYQPQEPVINAGEPADSLYIVALGHLEVHVATHEGIFSVAQIAPGQCVGELALVYDLPTRSATVVASQATTVLKIQFSDLRLALEHIPGSYERVAANLSQLVDKRASDLQVTREL